MREADSAGPEQRTRRVAPLGDDLRGAGDALLAIVPGALVVVFAFQSGGFFPAPVTLVTVVLLVALVLRVLAARRPFAGAGRLYVVGAAVIGAFALWVLASAAWSDAPARALVEYDRALLYVVGFVLVGAVARTTERLRWAIRSIAAAALVVCVCALVTRLVPEIWPIVPTSADTRMSYPLTYWNALGLLAALGLILCVALTCDDREPPAGRVLSAAGMPVLAVTLLLTFSRGSIAVAIVGLVALVIVGRPRALLGGLLVGAPTVAVALFAAYRADLLAGEHPTSAAAAAQGHHVAAVLVACVAVAAIGRFALLRLDVRLAAFAAQMLRGHRSALRGATVASVLVVVGLALAFSLPVAIGRQYHRFVDGSPVDVGGDRRTRLTNPDNNGRIEQWRIAVEGFSDHPLHGDGAGTFQLRWQRERPRDSGIVDAHSLYAEVLGELGIVGLVLVVSTLLLVLGGFLALARGPDRVVGGALFAAGLAWAAHAGIEWDWEMPAVTFWLFAAGGLALARPQGHGLAVIDRELAETGRVWRAVVGFGCLALMLAPLRLYGSIGPLRDSVRALAANDCPRALDRARTSTARLAIRPEPFVVTGYCEVRVGQPRSAVRAFDEAVRLDPRNWEVHYGLGLVRAAAGLDPRPQLRIAHRLNPLNKLPIESLSLLGDGGPRVWTVRAPHARIPGA